MKRNKWAAMKNQKQIETGQKSTFNVSQDILAILSKQLGEKSRYLSMRSPCKKTF